jgi:hypothetical protein
MRTPLIKRKLKMAIDLPAITIVHITPSNLGAGAAVEARLSVKPVAPGVWDEFL